MYLEQFLLFYHKSHSAKALGVLGNPFKNTLINRRANYPKSRYSKTWATPRGEVIPKGGGPKREHPASMLFIYSKEAPAQGGFTDHHYGSMSMGKQAVSEATSTPGFCQHSCVSQEYEEV